MERDVIRATDSLAEVGRDCVELEVTFRGRGRSAIADNAHAETRFRNVRGGPSDRAAADDRQCLSVELDTGLRRPHGAAHRCGDLLEVPRRGKNQQHRQLGD